MRTEIKPGEFVEVPPSTDLRRFIWRNPTQPPDIGDIVYNSGDEVALADDAKGESNWRGKMADRCHPLSALGARLLATSNAFFRTSKFFHAPDGRPVAQPGTSRHANIKPKCHD